MGQEMRTRTLSFVSFEPYDGAFRAFLSIHTALGADPNPEDLAQDAAAIYQSFIEQMRSAIERINDLRRTHTPVPARRVWQLGDLVFRLKSELGELGLELDGVYEHLTRDLSVKRKWLEKVVILRRYVDEVSRIPERLNWGRVEKGTAKASRRINDGLPPD